jgi:hypothetical protein
VKLDRSVAVALVLAAAVARADGAFPDSMQVLLPADRPHEIILTTNFGLVLSDDDGATWRWVCEQAVASWVSLYQMGPPPDETLFAVSPPEGLSTSRDVGCSWSFAQGSLAGAQLLDAFPDPTDGAHVLALATPSAANRPALVESHDGGQSFGAPLYLAPASGLLNGVEIARSAPRTIYLTGFTADVDPKTTRAFLVRSTDGGASFQTFDESPLLGAQTLALAAVDPIDALKLYLRVLGPSTDSLALSTDGGATLAVALALPTRMSAFLRRADGTLLVGTRDAQLFVSRDGGATFSSLAGAPHLRGLAERGPRLRGLGAVLYAAADNLVDGFALASSTDGGAHWTPLLSYPQILGPLLCGNIDAVCAAPWQMLSAMFNPAPPAPPSPPAPRSAPSGGCTVGGGAECGAPWLLLGLGLIGRAIRRVYSPGRRRLPCAFWS